jgi:hypothetical protein
MAEIKEFVINDRRKFTAEGELRPEAKTAQRHSPEPSGAPEPGHSAQTLTTPPIPFGSTAPDGPASAATQVPESQVQESQLRDSKVQETPLPTAEQAEQAKRAYDATVDRLDTAIRATNPGMERPPEITLQQVIQSLYMQALMQLGGAAPPGQQPQVDLLGARQTIDMLVVLQQKTLGNRTPAETELLDTALFELRIDFLEVTQALSRSAVARQTQSATSPAGPSIPGTGPRIVR